MDQVEQWKPTRRRSGSRVGGLFTFLCLGALICWGISYFLADKEGTSRITRAVVDDGMGNERLIWRR